MPHGRIGRSKGSQLVALNLGKLVAEGPPFAPPLENHLSVFHLGDCWRLKWSRNCPFLLLSLPFSFPFLFVLS